MRKRESNPNWRGGRVVDPRGYVLIRVGTEHHLSDVRGYAYEHRINAEMFLGRVLEQGEIVHHIDGNRQNNEPENLEIVSSNHEHFTYHRKKRKYELRKPKEKNKKIKCGCGCGTSFLKYDEHRRPRRFVTGHNMKIVGKGKDE